MARQLARTGAKAESVGSDGASNGRHGGSSAPANGVAASTRGGSNRLTRRLTTAPRQLSAPLLLGSRRSASASRAAVHVLLAAVGVLHASVFVCRPCRVARTACDCAGCGVSSSSHGSRLEALEGLLEAPAALRDDRRTGTCRTNTGLRLSAYTTLRHLLPSQASQAQVVPPGVWPGVADGAHAHASRCRAAGHPAPPTRAPPSEWPAPCADLRIIGRELAGGEHVIGWPQGIHLRTAELLQLGDAAGVIRMRVRIEDGLHVGELEAQRLDVGLDLRRGCRASRRRSAHARTPR